MTTISPNRRRGTGNSRLRLFAGGIAFVIIFFVLLLWRDPIAGLLWRALGPLSGMRNNVAASTGILFGGFASQQTLAKENASLRAELASSSIAVLDRDALYAENLDLKARLNRTVHASSSVLAAVLSRAPATPYDMLMLDVGSKDGIVVGDTVAAGGSIYIGKITQVYPTTSRALLFSAPGETYDALLISSSTSRVATPVSVTGQGAGGLVAQVPAGVNVVVGDKLEFPGIAVQLIATVTAIDSSAAESFETIYMHLPINPQSLHYVEVRRIEL